MIVSLEIIRRTKSSDGRTMFVVSMQDEKGIGYIREMRPHEYNVLRTRTEILEKFCKFSKKAEKMLENLESYARLFERDRM